MAEEKTVKVLWRNGYQGRLTESKAKAFLDQGKVKILSESKPETPVERETKKAKE